MPPLEGRDGRPVIKDFLWTEAVEDHIWDGHQLTKYHVEEAMRAADMKSHRVRGDSLYIEGRTRSGLPIGIYFKAKDGYITPKTAFPLDK